jgi:hypothetical protein
MWVMYLLRLVVHVARYTVSAEKVCLTQVFQYPFHLSRDHPPLLVCSVMILAWLSVPLLGTLFDPCRLAYLAYTSND